VRRALILLFPLLVGFDLLQSPNKAVEEGNARLKGGKAEEALGHYDEAVKKLPADPGVHFDRGAALFALSRYDEAVPEFLRATEAKTSALKAAAFYNLGNAFFKTEKYGDAIAAYRRSLVFDPQDVRAKWNLELALKKKKDQDKKDQDKDKDNKKQNKDQNKDKQDQQDKKDQGKDDPKKPDQKEQSKDQQDKQDKQDKKDQKQDQNEKQAKQDKNEKNEQQPKESQGNPPPPEKAADMKEIEAVLDSLERSPKDLEQERARRRMVRRAPPTKDW
jgi:tetratricopeptide (TPR) repeat protein